ncbi:MAG: 2-oxo acid dehydrogenase subunit E2 [Myxococcales bacterium]|nr:2-oxo acid dehydrogenase subunit E2 [Myxococcales bacterium]
MAEFFVMPQASPTMTVGVVGKWLAPEGSALVSSQAIASVETDKATMEIEVFDKGVMLKHLAAEGQEVPPGQPIAIIGLRADEDISALVAAYAAMVAAAAAPVVADTAAPTATATAVATAEATPTVAATSPVAAAAGQPTSPPPAAVGEPGHSEATAWHGRTLDASFMEARPPFVSPVPRVMASPLARKLAEEAGVKLSRVRGSGPGGRIVAADVEGASAGGRSPARGTDQTSRVTQMRKTIARRLTDVHQQVPVFYLTTSFDATAVMALKDAVARRAGKDGARISVNDVLVRCVAAALREVPAVNAQWAGDTIVQKGSVDVGVAVALPEGLITPVVRDADQKSIVEIGAEVRALAARAREGKLLAEEYTGGSFTISNLGMFSIEQFTAILNPPEAAILAVGSAAPVPAVQNGVVVAQWRMSVTMTCDHRVIDGALGARFLEALRGYVENPGMLAVG